ncbi:MAG TPA: prepilin-type N-terminal cleavage/methylation domain-containing protein [Phycisphaerales bacterium]|nr:prepilin-type N-terminal cleavage/methylation domain-containing protein [Phycisphaerales bacterium]
MIRSAGWINDWHAPEPNVISRRIQNPRFTNPYRAFSLIELAIAVAVIAILLAILLPALRAARASTQRDTCSAHQRSIGEAWFTYLDDHNSQFPSDLQRPEWNFGGVRFGVGRKSFHPDAFRPLTPYLTDGGHEFLCPSDTGIHDSLAAEIGDDRTFDRYGTSYRANPLLFDASRINLGEDHRGVMEHEIQVAPSRLVLMGDAGWLESADNTGASANWHGKANTFNILFFDGSVRFSTVLPRTDRNQPILFSPVLQNPASTEAAPADKSAASKPPAADENH